VTATPPLLTYVRAQIDQRERSVQTAFPAKVLSWSSADNTVKLEPQFLEVWRDGSERRVETIDEPADAYIDNVPVCFPRHMSWTVATGDFGLVICTKFSLDLWRQRRSATDPGDLRRFGMSGATFHPVLMDETPPTQQFVALANLVKSELDAIETTFNSIVFTVHAGATVGEIATPYTAGEVASATVKVSE